ncbi:MAG: carboxypeptidase M32 [Candidatus Margulisiibacteriota bacterium]
MKKFNTIIRHLSHINTLSQISSLLSWDQETYMPPDAINARASQLQVMAGLIHDEWQSDELKNELNQYFDFTSYTIDDSLSSEEYSFIKELSSTWIRNTRLTKSLVQELTKATTTAQHAWASARKNDDFATFAPYLKNVIDLTREKIKQLGSNDHPYNTLLDEFEPGMTVNELDNIFTPLKNETINFLNEYSPSTPPSINGPFDYEQQLIYSKELMTMLGYDTKRGRLDISTHPFTIDIHPNDVRITTRINTNYLMESISSTIHEVGHGLYEQGLDPQWAGTPYGSARSMGIHESQSRLWEIFIGQSLPFWEGQLDRLQTLFPSTKSNSAMDFHQHCRTIKPHWCRVESDIITYNLHIILRYECEKALFSNELDVDMLPEFWNQKMNDYLGIKSLTPAKGCLQDVHWSAGLFGYFPSYTLGTLIAAELFKHLSKLFFPIDQKIRNGEFKPIKDWLNEHIHFQGSKKTTHQLLDDLGISYNPASFLNSFIP